MEKLTVIISYYKALDNLELILKSLNNQSCMDFEVILSEDDNNQETNKFVEDAQTKLNFPLFHLHQKFDYGFRKTAMLNRAINRSSTDKIAFIDGDCIPHKHFVMQYIRCIDTESICIGRAVMLDKTITEKIRNSKKMNSLNLFRLFFSKSRKAKDAIYLPWFSLTYKTRGLVGRNWGCHKKSLFDINGFDEDYIHAGVGEDCDIEWRLMANGIKIKSVKNKAIVYHLYHRRWYFIKETRNNFEMMQQKIDENKIQCINGIKTIDNN